jgi:hypothetical protein
VWGQKPSSSSTTTTSDDIPDSVKSFRYPSTVVVGSSQSTCFEAIGAPLLDRMSQGYNTTLLAYGQTGSGKTFTVFGPTGSLTESSLEQANESKTGADGGDTVPVMWGIFPRIAHAMVSDSRHVKASAIEIYQNAPFDLLNNRAPLQVSRARHATKTQPVKVTSKSSTIGGGKYSSNKVGLNGEHPGSCTCRLCYKAKMEAKEARKNGRQSSGLGVGGGKREGAPPRRRTASTGGGGEARTVGETLWSLKTYQDVAKLARHIETSRSAAGHALNDRSSRSHCIVRLHSSRTLSDGQIRSQKFTFVDLAGSERTRKSGVKGQRMSEAIGINNSLTVLGRCIRAVGKNEAHVPWRDVVLCQLLRSSFEGGGGGGRGKRSTSSGGAHAYCSVIVNVSPEHEDETMCTLRFGESVSCVSNRATVVVGRDASSAMDDLRLDIDSLQRKVKEMCDSGMAGGFVRGCQVTERQSLEANMAKHASAQGDVVRFKAMVAEADSGRRRRLMEEKLNKAIKEEHHFRMMVLRQQSIKTLWTAASPNYEAAVAELEEKKQQLSLMKGE